MTLSTLSKTTPRVFVPGDIYLVTPDFHLVNGAMFGKEVALWDGEDLATIKAIEGLFHKLKLVCTHPCGAMEFIVTGELLDATHKTMENGNG